jgi:hypothetical protein
MAPLQFPIGDGAAGGLFGCLKGRIRALMSNRWPISAPVLDHLVDGLYFKSS